MPKKPKFDFGFRKPAEVSNLFEVTDPASLLSYDIKNIEIDKLKPFKKHPFKLYEGQRLNDMCDSIREVGILLPIIVRPIDDGSYEILSGHNRTEAAKIIGLDVIPAIIRENLTEEEAMLIVTETNLIQRSFADLSHSERAVTLAMHHDAIKRQGKRTDIINEIETLLENDGNIRENADVQTFSQLGKKLNNVVKLGEEYGLSKNSIARYLRVNKLNESLKKRLDNKEFGIVPAVEISYLSNEEQDKLNIILDKPIHKLDIKKAELLREFSENNELTPKIIEDILSGISFRKRTRASLPVRSFKIRGKVLSKYFKPEDKQEEIEAELIEALEFYRAHKNMTVD